MTEYFLTVIGQVLTLFLLMLVGFLLGKTGRLSTQSVQQLTFLLLYIVTGCVILRSLQVPFDPELSRSLLLTAGLTALLHLLFLLCAQPLFRRRAPGTRASLRFGIIYGNIGFMGLPLIDAVLGHEALIFAAVYLAVYSLFYWTHGVVLMGGGANLTPRKVLLSPGVIAVVVGGIFFLTSFSLPPVLGNTVSFLADLNTPLAMIIIGFQIGVSDLGSIFRRPVLLVASALKLMLLPALAILVLLPLRLDPVVFCVMVILSATPPAGSVSLFAQQFGRDTDSAAQFVTLATLLSMLTLPLWALAARALSVGGA